MIETQSEQQSAQKIVRLPRGTLSLEYTLDDQADYQLADLLGFAQRINPKRSFLFVSKVLGRHIPVSPIIMRNAFTDLADKITQNSANLPQPIVVIGMAETAVGLSAGVHQVLQKTYPEALLLNSTRHEQSATLLTQFTEDHSHANQHLIYQGDDEVLQQQLKHCKTLIMVDDEASTGQTCQNVVTALQQAGLDQLQQVHLATLVDWSMGQIIDNPFEGIEFYRHHLLSGRWQWRDNPHAPSVSMPNVATTKAGEQPLLNTQHWGRVPTIDSTQGLSILLNHLHTKINLQQYVNKKVLVLGSNEFVWLPFLLAEWLTSQQCDAHFGSLTRSPISLLENDQGDYAQDYAINHKFSFADSYGLGMTNFVYNVQSQDWDLIVLCIETPSDSIDNKWYEFDNIVIISPEVS